MPMLPSLWFTCTPRPLVEAQRTARKLSVNRLRSISACPRAELRTFSTAAVSITADMAVCLGRYFGNGAQFWFDLQVSTTLAVDAVLDGWSEEARRPWLHRRRYFELCSTHPTRS